MTWLFPSVMPDTLQDAITLIFLIGNIISKNRNLIKTDAQADKSGSRQQKGKLIRFFCFLTAAGGCRHGAYHFLWLIQ